MTRTRPMQSRSLPKFRRPPVIETIIGVQFDPLPKFRNAHLGAFWTTLGQDWPRVSDAPTLEPQFERFGEGDRWGKLRFKVTQDPSTRARIEHADGTQMIQVQNGRFHYNWLGKGGGQYPHYPNVRAAFDCQLAHFRSFLASSALGELRPNQWEVTYLNHIPKGTVWQTPADWPALLAGLAAPSAGPASTRLESAAGEWHYEIPPQLGRLHVQLVHGKGSETDDGELLQLTLTARGPISEQTGPTDTWTQLSNGLDLGHRVIVLAFLDLTSDAAHEFWGLIHENG
ncbi:MAG: TIGR04255 family protein [Planctomycetes bacterium]|nr:TIGR04255 family protein [Planctomycetota bacterium]